MCAQAIEAKDPLDEMERETAVLDRLDERLAEYALALGTGADIPPGEIAEGLRLYEQYLRLHSGRFDDVLQPEARSVAMSTCFEHLDELRQEHARASVRVSEVRDALAAFARGESGGRMRLARELGALAEREHEEVRRENDYPLSCLRPTLPEEAASRVILGFERTRAELADLDRHVEAYLGYEPGKASASLAVRCSRPECTNLAAAESYPATAGGLGIRAPRGWRMSARSPHLVAGGVVAVRIDLLCPDHAEGSPHPAQSDPSKAASLAMTAQPTAPVPGHVVSACCAPLAPARP